MPARAANGSSEASSNYFSNARDRRSLCLVVAQWVTNARFCNSCYCNDIGSGFPKRGDAFSQPFRRGVSAIGGRVDDAWKNFAGEMFAEFDAPLVE